MAIALLINLINYTPIQRRVNFRERNRGAKMSGAYDHNLTDQLIEDLFFREWSKLVRYVKRRKEAN